MIVISWNVRGLNSLGKSRYLQDRLKKEKPQIVLLQETKVSRARLEAMLSWMCLTYEVIALDVMG